MTGPTGSGKSTTLAAIIDKINTRPTAKHIVTIEDPVEFVHPNKRSVFSHREVGSSTPPGFGPALRGGVASGRRRRPGRRDARPTRRSAWRSPRPKWASLVFGTLHTNSASKTIDRIIDAFPAKEQSQVRLSLSESLAAVVSQLLVPTADGKGRCAVHEILLRTSALPNIIREGKVAMLNSLIEGGRAQGMQSMDDTLFALANDGQIRPEDAYMKATNKARFEAMAPAGEQSAA